MSDNWFYEYFINEAKSIIRPCSGGGSVPKPLTYDYMPEGYPSKSVQTVTLMEEQEVAFTSADYFYMAQITNAFEVVVGQTYTVNWDGTEYECVGAAFGEGGHVFGNLSIMGAGDDTGEPFIYAYNTKQAVGMFATLDTAASHTISVTTSPEIITPMSYDYMPEGYPKKRGCSIEWDGNTEGLVSVLEMLYKVSDLLPTDDELIGSTIKLSNGNKLKITSAYIQAVSEDITYVGDGDIFIAVVKKDNAIFEDTTFPQKGTYFAKQQNNNKAAKPNPLYVQKLTEVITPMAEEFMPPRIVEDIGAVADVANNATTTANAAKTTADRAETTANSAQGTADRAETTANRAEITATNAQTTADAAKTTATNAQTTATNAQTTADAAKTTADAAKTTADAAKTTANTAKAALDKALIVEPNGNIFPPIRYMNDGAYQSLVLTSKDQKHQTKFAITESTGLEITVGRDGGVVSSTSANPSTVNFKSNGANSIQLSGINALIMSPINSTKKFKITVDDTGTLSATEVT